MINNTKKRILFVLDSYHVGGTTVSTRNIVGLLDKNQYDTYVWVLSDVGLLKDLYRDCNLIKTCYVIHALMMSSHKEDGNIMHSLGAIVLRFLRNHSPWFKKKFYSHAVKKCLRDMSFDTIIACAEGKTTDFVSFMNHSNRVAWVRCDYANYYTPEQITSKRTQYSCYNHIICVSEKVKESFDAVYPEYAEKTISVHNPQDSSLLKKWADNDDGDERFKTDKLCIVSIGRVCELKRFYYIPSIASQLEKKGLDFRWYIIGDGEESEMNRIVEEIKKYSVSDKVIVLGAKSNAHFYISKADLLVTVSRSEACPRVVNEAKVLNTPVVSTDYRTIYEYINDHENGIITTLERVSDAIYEIVNDRDLYEKIQMNISNFDFNNKDLLNKIYSVI